MDTVKAFILGRVNKDKESMVFDWEKAATLIRDRKPQVASAGLAGDWEWTSGVIFADGVIPERELTYLSSTWAVPQLDLDGEIIECYRMHSETPGWNAETYWPPEALAIINQESE